MAFVTTGDGTEILYKDSGNAEIINRNLLEFLQG